jgi:hypothetical protein
MQHLITARKVLAATSIFFAVLFFFMNVVLLLPVPLTGSVPRLSGTAWWRLYYLCILVPVVMYCIRIGFPKEKLNNEEKEI